MSTIQKLFVTMLLVSGGLVFYAVGIVTNFFGQPMFSMFFVISNSTAHNLVDYIAIGAAIVISIPAVTSYLWKRKPLPSEMRIKPTLPLVQTNRKAVTSPNFVMIVEPQETTSSAQKMTPIKPTQTAIAPRIRTVSGSTIQQTPVKQEITQTSNNSDKLNCPSCKKEFTTPMLMLDYSSAKTDLVSYCPYCFERVGQQKKSE